MNKELSLAHRLRVLTAGKCQQKRYKASVYIVCTVRKKRKMKVNDQVIFSFVPSPGICTQSWDGAAHIKMSCSSVADLTQKLPHRHVQTCLLADSRPCQVSHQYLPSQQDVQTAGQQKAVHQKQNHGRQETREG